MDASRVHEITMMILDNCSLKDLAAYSLTSRKNRDLVADNLHSRFRRSVGRNIHKIEIFRNLLRITGGIVSGSPCALFVKPFADGRSVPNDLDVYIPKSEILIWKAFIVESEGYTLLDTIDEQPPDDFVTPSAAAYNIPSEIHQVLRYRRSDGGKLDLIVSKTESPLRPLLLFHLTIVIGFFTGDLFFTAYRPLTLEAKGFVNPCVLIGPDRDLRPARVIEACRKYEHRGFTLAAKPTDIYPDHVCGEHFACPHTFRNPNDDFCFTIPYVRDSQLLPADRAEKVLRIPEFDIWWRLGGPPCDDSEGPYTTHLIF